MKSILNQELEIKEFLPFKIIPKMGSSKELKLYENKSQFLLKTDKCRFFILNKKIILDKSDLVAIGLYIAEGDKYINLDRKYHHSGEAAFVSNEKNCLNLIIDLFEKLGIPRDRLKWKIGLNIKHSLDKEKLFNYWIDQLKLNQRNNRPGWLYRTGSLDTKLNFYSSKNGCLHIIYGSVIFRNILLNFIDKIFDLCIENKLKKELALILQGYFAGDGNVDYSPKFNRKQVEFTCHNLELISKIKESLRVLGLKSIKETWPEKTKTHSKALRIYNKKDFEILNKYKIPFLLDYKKEKFMKIINSY